MVPELQTDFPMGYIWSINLVLGSFESCNLPLYVANWVELNAFYSGFNLKFLVGDAHYFIVIAHLWPLGGDKKFFRKKEFCSVFIKEQS